MHHTDYTERDLIIFAVCHTQTTQNGHTLGATWALFCGTTISPLV